LIAPHLIKNEYKLIKTIKGSSMMAHYKDAIDDIWITMDKVVNGSIPIKDRCRPFYPKPYREMFCPDAPNCELECQKCYELEKLNTYWDGFDISFPTGRVNNVIVFDIDPRNIPGFTDMKSFIDSMKLRKKNLPKTWISRTPRNGLHFYYRSSIRMSKNDTLVKGCDILGDGFCSKLPPSKREGIGSYEWLSGCSPDEIKLADAPEWMTCGAILNNQKIISNTYKPTYSFPEDHEVTRNKVKAELNRVPVTAFKGGEEGHRAWLTIGSCLCQQDIGMEDLFLEWCQRDSKNMLNKKQLQWMKKQTGSKIGLFFEIMKNK